MTRAVREGSSLVLPGGVGNQFIGPMRKKLLSRILKIVKNMGLTTNFFCIEKKELIIGDLSNSFGPSQSKILLLPKEGITGT